MSASRPQATHAPTVEDLRQVLREVIDPEIGVNIVDLGLVYRIDIEPQCVVVEMTMTSVTCPLADLILQEMDDLLARRLPPRTALDIRLVWTPAWDPTMMSPTAKQQLGW